MELYNSRQKDVIKLPKECKSSPNRSPLPNVVTLLKGSGWIMFILASGCQIQPRKQKHGGHLPIGWKQPRGTML